MSHHMKIISQTIYLELKWTDYIEYNLQSKL